MFSALVRSNTAVFYEHTHTVEVVEDLVHAYDFIVQLVVAIGGG